MVLSDGVSTLNPRIHRYTKDLVVPRFWAPTTDESEYKINLYLSILDLVLVSWRYATLVSVLDTLQFAPAMFERDSFVI